MKKILRKLLPLLLILALALGGCAAASLNSPENGGEYVHFETVRPAEPTEEAAPEPAAAAMPEPAPEQTAEQTPEPAPEPEQTPALAEEGSYTTKEDVALYLRLYGHLPDNFITKKEAQALGWSGGSLEEYAPGKCIGGDRFGNYEGLLPKGKKYTECDIDTLGAGSRGARRIVFSDDGCIYYTDDHYESFTLLYGEEEP